MVNVVHQVRINFGWEKVPCPPKANGTYLRVMIGGSDRIHGVVRCRGEGQELKSFIC